MLCCIVLGVVVVVLHECKVLIRRVYVPSTIYPKQMDKDVVYLLSLFVCLWVKGCGHVELCAQQILKDSLDGRDELGISILKMDVGNLKIIEVWANKSFAISFSKLACRLETVIAFFNN